VHVLRHRGYRLSDSFCSANFFVHSVPATQPSHLPIAIQITSFLMHTTFSNTTTMGSTATESLDLDQDARITLTISHLRANPDQSIRQIARTFDVPRLTLNHRFIGRQSVQQYSQAQQKLSVIEEDSLIKRINTIVGWGWPPRV